MAWPRSSARSALRTTDSAGMGRDLANRGATPATRSNSVRVGAGRSGGAEEGCREGLEAARGYSGEPLDVLAARGESVPEHPMLGVLDGGYEEVEQRALLRDVIAQLPEQEREILLLRFVANKTQTEIAALIGV